MKALNELYEEKPQKQTAETHQDSNVTTLETHEDDTEEETIAKYEEIKEDRIKPFVDTVDEAQTKNKFLSRLKSRSKIVSKAPEQVRLVLPEEETVHDLIH